MTDAAAKVLHDYHLDVPPRQEVFPVKGAGHCDWGMQNRMARLFNPKSGNTVMLAFDHGYIMGPTAGLERIDVTIPPLIPYVDVLMGTKGGHPRLPAAHHAEGEMHPCDLRRHGPV